MSTDDPSADRGNRNPNDEPLPKQNTGANEIQNSREQRLLDSLLASAFNNGASDDNSHDGCSRLNDTDPDQQRLQRLMTAVVAEATTRKPAELQTVRSRRWIVAWVTAAATLLILLPWLPSSFQSAATARVQRSLSIAEQNTPRHYQLEIELENSDDATTRTINGDLYVKGSQCLAVRIPALIAKNREAWAGHNADQAWVVPAFGPVLIGDELGLGRWLRSKQEVATPYLHLTTLLQKMIVAYQLEELPLESLPPSTSGVVLAAKSQTNTPHYQRIRGTKKISANDRFPQTIDLWTDPASGFVHRLEASWAPNDKKIHKRKITLTFLSDAPLPHDWFDHQAHHSERRRLINFDKQDNSQEVSDQSTTD